MVWNLEEGAVKPFAHFDKDILMLLKFKEAAVKPFIFCSNDILTFDYNLMKFRSWLARMFPVTVASVGGLRQPPGGPIGNLCSFEGSI